MLKVQGRKKKPVIFTKEQLARALKMSEATIQQDLRPLALTGLILYRRVSDKGQKWHLQYMFNLERWKGRKGSERRQKERRKEVLDILASYGAGVPPAKFGELKSKIDEILSKFYTDYAEALEVFRSDDLFWRNTSLQVQLEFVKTLAKARDKKLGRLMTYDFEEYLSEFNNKSLMGLLNYYKKASRSAKRGLKNLREILGIKELPILPYKNFKEALDALKKGKIRWGRTTPKIQLEFIKILARAREKKRGLLIFVDFRKHLPEFNHRSLRKLPFHYREGGKSFIEAVKNLKKKLGIRDLVIYPQRWQEKTTDWDKVCKILAECMGIKIEPSKVITYLKTNKINKETDLALGKEVQAGNGAAREAMIEAYRGKLEYYAKRLHSQNPDMTKDELESEGLIALAKCVERYDPKRGVSFLTYIGTGKPIGRYGRIAGAMFDSILRKRGARRKAKEIPYGFPEDIEGHKGYMAEVTEKEIPPGITAPEKRVPTEEEIERINSLLAGKVSKRDREEIFIPYLRGEKQYEIAYRSELTPSRISQIIGKCRRIILKENKLAPRSKGSIYIPLLSAIMVVALSGIIAYLWQRSGISAQSLQTSIATLKDYTQFLTKPAGFVGMLLLVGITVDISRRLMGIPVRGRVIEWEEIIKTLRDLVKQLYRRVSIAIGYLRKLAVLRFAVVLGLGIAEKVWKSVEEGARRFFAVIAHHPSERSDLRLSWFSILNQRLSEEEITEVMALLKKLNEREEIGQLFAEESSYPGVREVNPLLQWTPLTKKVEVEPRAVGEFVERLRGYESVAVIGQKTVRAVVGREISPEKTLFVLSSPGVTNEAYKQLHEELVQIYQSRGIPAGKIESKVAEHFVWIEEGKTTFGEEDRERKFLRRFNVSEGKLVLLALAGVNIEGFLKGVKKGMAMCSEENPEENPGVQLALLEKAMKKTGRERILLVLPEGLERFGKVWQGLISLLGREGEGVIPVMEGELTGPESYGENMAFVKVSVGTEIRVRRLFGRSPFRVTAELREAGYPVFDLPLPGKEAEAIGALLYIEEFAKALSYAPESVAATFGLGKAEPFSEYQIGREAFQGKPTKVVAVHLPCLLGIEVNKEADSSRMNLELKVRPKSRAAFDVIQNIVKAAEEEGNPDGVSFAFVSDTEGVTSEVMAQMLRDFMTQYGLSPEIVARVVDKRLIIDRKTLKEAGGIGEISRKIKAESVFYIIAERLLGRTDGNGITVNIITADENRWEKVPREIMERVLWVVLNPAEEGKVLSTAEGLVVAIEGRVSEWLVEFIKKSYGEEAEKLLPEIRKDGTIFLPATPVDEEHLEKIKIQEKVYQIQA